MVDYKTLTRWACEIADAMANYEPGVTIPDATMADITDVEAARFIALMRDHRGPAISDLFLVSDKTYIKRYANGNGLTQEQASHIKIMPACCATTSKQFEQPSKYDHPRKQDLNDNKHRIEPDFCQDISDKKDPATCDISIC